MTQVVTTTSILPAAKLSVSYISPLPKNELESFIPEAIIITDPDFIITGFNDIAVTVYGFNSIAAQGKNLFKLIKFETVGTSLNLAIKSLFRNGYWKGDIIYNQAGKKLIFYTCCNLIKDDTRLTTSIVITTHTIPGVLKNFTETKKLAAQLIYDQLQKQKMINQVAIKAQEKERNRISGELHDNVNQLLMSARLHICVAKNKTVGQTNLLEKANEYLLMAVEEIRSLSKKLTSTVLTHVGLQKSIAEIAANMLLLKNIQLHTNIRDEVVAKMSSEQHLMVYRIIQEQSNNILKYADTTEASITLKEVNHQVELVISDKGKGFDKTEQKTNGIGLINICNRVDAYSGKLDIITSPGNGCTLIINFPLSE
ncbi:MAG: hypothetical protein H7Z13_01025 [Ferruginibacter sp.]|nr:hypothetical protein [Ferruginibacter sp.]